MKTDMQKFIDSFKSNHPIRDCLGCGNGRWKWIRCLDGIDLRYGHNSKKSAEMHRAKSAYEAWSLHLLYDEREICHCGKVTTHNVINAMGECSECAGRRQPG